MSASSSVAGVPTHRRLVLLSRSTKREVIGSRTVVGWVVQYEGLFQAFADFSVKRSFLNRQL